MEREMPSGGPLSRPAKRRAEDGRFTARKRNQLTSASRLRSVTTMSARFDGHVCFRCGEPVFTSRYRSGGASLCAACDEEAREEAEETTREQRANEQEPRNESE